MNFYTVELISVLVALSALAMIRVKDLFALVVLFAIYSAFLALLFAAFGAVDVAFTEAVVGTGVSTLFLMALIWYVDPNELTRGATGRRVAAGVVAVAVGGALIYGIHALPPFGDPQAPATVHEAPVYYLSQSMEDMRTPNVVTAVLGDYRSLDTLIEAAVVVTAAVACLLVMSRNDDPTL